MKNQFNLLSRSLLTVSALAIAMNVAAQSSENSKPTAKIDEIIVSSSRVEQPLRQIGTSVSVITEDDINAQSFTDLADVLRTTPGIGVSNSGGLGKPTTLRIRGEEGYRSKVYIDGMDVSDTSTPQVGPQVQQIMTRGVSRVEVLRGPQGMMYGADAGGVVNVSTRKVNSGLTGDVSAEGGTYNSGQGFAQIGGGNETGDFNLSGLHTQTDGFNTRTTDIVNPDDDGYENETYHARAGLNIGEGFRVDAVVRSVEGENEYDGCFGGAPTYSSTNDCSDEYSQLSWRTSLDWQGEKIGQTLALQQTDTERENFSDGASSFEYQGDIERIEYTGSLKFSDLLAFVYGIEDKNETFESSFGDEWEQKQLGYFVEYQGNFSDSFFLTAGVRQDDNDDFGKHTSYRLTAAKLIELGDNTLKFKGSYGTGFRAPSLYEVAYNAAPYNMGPELSEETSEGYEVGAEMFFAGGAFAELVYFDQRINDQIVFSNSAFVYEQAQGESQSTGVELSGSLPLGEIVNLRGNYTYNIAEQEDGSVRVLRPKNQMNLGVDFNLFGDSLLLGAFWRYSDEAVDSTGVTLDDYQVVTLSARYFPIEALEISARIENAFDEDYTEVATYNTSERAAYLGVSYHF